MKTLLSLRTWTQKSHQQMLSKQTCGAGLTDVHIQLESGGETAQGPRYEDASANSRAVARNRPDAAAAMLLFAWSQLPMRRLWLPQKQNSGSKLWMRSLLH